MKPKHMNHYVQARYLDGFLVGAETQLLCYGRGWLAPFRAIPDKLARQRDFYAIPDAPVGTNIEELLEKDVESPGLEALRQLVNERAAPILESRIKLGRYIAFQEMRVPHTRDQLKKQLLHVVTHLEKGLREAEASEAMVYPFATTEGEIAMAGEPFQITREEAEAQMAELERNLDTFDLPGMIDLANEITPFYVQMRWTLLLAEPGSFFITSDNPVFRTFSDPNLRDEALLRSDVKVFYPLTREAVLVMQHDFDFLVLALKETAEGNGHTLPPTDFRQIPKSEVAMINAEVAEQSTEWCFSGEAQEWLPEVLRRNSKRGNIRLFSDSDSYEGRWTRS